jgi:replicative DNA helicase
LGFEADIILLDYVDLLKPPKTRKSNKEEIDDLYYGTKGFAKEIELPLWSVSQVNRAGAQDEVVEGDKSAGSYDKMMVIDFGMSQSRKRKDKTSNSARWHIMKNRYGGDGMTWNVKADLSIGHFEILDEYDENQEPKEEPKKKF